MLRGVGKEVEHYFDGWLNVGGGTLNSNGLIV